MATDIVATSKFLSFILRHNPSAIGLDIDSNGWVIIDELIQKSLEHGYQINRELLDLIVETSDKQRFLLDESRRRIRANQGHSIAVDLGLAPKRPPENLFHGTASRFLESIRASGLLKGDRQHVHLSSHENTAIKVGQRHGKSVVLLIHSGTMWQNGVPFYCSANGVWLVDSVPPSYICFPD